MIDSRPKIHLWHGLVFFLAAISMNFLVFAVVVVIGFIIKYFKGDPSAVLLSPAVVSIQLLVTSSILAALSVMLAKRRGYEPADILSLTSTSIGTVAAACIGILGLGFLVDEILFLAHSIAPSLFVTGRLALFSQVFADASIAGFILLTAVVAIGPGIGEELFFRGLLLKTFHKGLSKHASVLMSAFLFGLIHMDVLQGTGAFVIGLYLGFIVLRTGSIWPAMAAHGLNNITSALSARYGLVETKQLWKQGHSAWIIIVSAVVFIAACFVVKKPVSRNQ